MKEYTTCLHGIKSVKRKLRICEIGHNCGKVWENWNERIIGEIAHHRGGGSLCNQKGKNTAHVNERNKNSCIVIFCALLRLLGVVSARFFSFLERVEETTLPPRVSYWPGATSHQPFFPTTLLAKKAIHLLPVSTNTCDYYCAFSSNTREEI